MKFFFEDAQLYLNRSNDRSDIIHLFTYLYIL